MGVSYSSGVFVDLKTTTLLSKWKTETKTKQEVVDVQLNDNGKSADLFLN